MSEVVRIITALVDLLREDRDGVLGEGEFDARLWRLVDAFGALGEIEIGDEADE